VANILRLASVVICVITVASFALFAVSETGTASAHQQRELNGEIPYEVNAQGTNAVSPTGEHKSSVRRALDEASNTITSPFAGVVTGTHSEWTQRGVKLLLALLLYGFGLAFIARLIRVRV